MASVIARELDGDLDVILVRPVLAGSLPGAIHATVCESGEIAINSPSRTAAVTEEILAQVILQALVDLVQERALHTPFSFPADPHGRTVILVADGVARGYCLQAAVQAIRSREPARLIVALAAAPGPVVNRLRALADEVVCLEVTSGLAAVGRTCRDWRRVSEGDGIAILQMAKAEHVA